MINRKTVFSAVGAFMCLSAAGYAVANPAAFPGFSWSVMTDKVRGKASPADRMRQIERPSIFSAESGLSDPMLIRAAYQPDAGQPEEAEDDSEVPEEASAQNDTAQNAPPFSFETVIAKARVLSRSPYEKPRDNLPSSFADLNYDSYRRITPRPRTADWAKADSSFQVYYSPQGFLFKDPVKINLVEEDTAREKVFDPSTFNFYDLPVSDEDKQKISFAGFRLTSPINSAGKFDEFLSFQGASYFRALGAQNHYGASARGLALSTASPNGEEFPVFREFWLKKPEPGQNSVELYALLDSESVSGAYKFTARPGVNTVIDVDAVLFPRRELNHVGFAPLTSMFDFGPHDPIRTREDFRPRVHDSEGLMIRMRNGEWVWRPLVNPTQLEISSFTREIPHGFGLMQRNRDFDEYQDLEAHYETRPSIWVEPRGDWMPGRLELIEIPTSNEFNDNIVAYWRPQEALKADEEYTLSYTMHWGAEAPMQPSVARVEATRFGIPVNNQNNRLFVIDYASANEALLDGAQINVSASSGTVSSVTLTKNPKTGGRRLSFELDPEGANVSELRAVLTRAGEPVSETWLYRWRR